MTTSSRLTAKYQATIPRPVRCALGIGRGDRIAFVIHNDQVWLRKDRIGDRVYAKALEPAMGEWATAEDDEAYQGLERQWSIQRRRGVSSGLPMGFKEHGKIKPMKGRAS